MSVNNGFLKRCYKRQGVKPVPCSPNQAVRSVEVYLHNDPREIKDREGYVNGKYFRSQTYIKEKKRDPRRLRDYYDFN